MLKQNAENVKYIGYGYPIVPIKDETPTKDPLFTSLIPEDLERIIAVVHEVYGLPRFVQILADAPQEDREWLLDHYGTRDYLVEIDEPLQLDLHPKEIFIFDRD